MNCIHCGQAVEENIDLCPYCGKCIQIVPDYSLLSDDDYLKQMIADENSNKGKSALQKKRELEEKQRKSEENRRKKIIYLIVGVILAVGIIVFAVIFTLYSINKKHAASYDYQLQKALEYRDLGNAQEALLYYHNAIVLLENPNDLSLRRELLDYYLELGTAYEDDVLVLCQEMIRIDPDYVFAYQTMLSVYEKRQDIESILQLADTANSTDVLSLFTDYLAVEPTFSLAGGVYDDYITVELFAPEGMQIYYSFEEVQDLISEGALYTEPLQLNDNKKTYNIFAVSINSYNVTSDVVTETYEINIAPPNRPIVSPELTTVTSETYVSVTVPDGCVAYYTWDGSSPSASSARYTGPILIPEGSHVFSVILVDQKTGLFSEKTTHNYVYFPESADDEET